MIINKNVNKKNTYKSKDQGYHTHNIKLWTRTYTYCILNRIINIYIKKKILNSSSFCKQNILFQKN